MPSRAARDEAIPLADESELTIWAVRQIQAAAAGHHRDLFVAAAATNLGIALSPDVPVAIAEGTARTFEELVAWIDTQDRFLAFYDGTVPSSIGHFVEWVATYGFARSTGPDQPYFTFGGELTPEELAEAVAESRREVQDEYWRDLDLAREHLSSYGHSIVSIGRVQLYGGNRYLSWPSKGFFRKLLKSSAGALSPIIGSACAASRFEWQARPIRLPDEGQLPTTPLMAFSRVHT